MNVHIEEEKSSYPHRPSFGTGGFCSLRRQLQSNRREQQGLLSGETVLRSRFTRWASR